MEADVVRLDKKLEKKEEFLTDEAGKEAEEFKDTNIKLANSYIDSAESALEDRDVQRASVMVNKAKKLVGQQQVEDISKEKDLDLEVALDADVSSGDGEEIKQSDSGGLSEINSSDSYVENAANNVIALSPVQAECIKAVYTPEERGKNALAREENEKSEKTINIQVKQQYMSR
jgi:hypothetical protein